MNGKTALPIFMVLLGAVACGSNGDEASQSSAQTVSAAQCAAAKAWSEPTPYAAGDLVSYNGNVYQCVQSHTSEPGWEPPNVAALWAPVTCAGGGGSSGGSSGGGSSSGACGGGSSGGSGGGSSGGGSGSSSGSSSGSGSGSGSSSGGGNGGGGSGGVAAGFIFSPYKDTSINMNWNTNVIQTNVSGSAQPLTQDIKANGGSTVTLAFATGECGSENWGGVPGAAMATANASMFQSAGVKYILSTGGAAGSFTCGSDSGFSTFLSRWASPNLIGVDFDIEAGQSQQVITDLVSRIKTAHGQFPGLRFSLTIATLANNNGGSTAQSLGGGVQDSLNIYGDETLGAVKSVLGFNGSAASWPSYVTVNLMTMDYGSASAGVCVVSGGTCQMGQSAIQAAFNLHDKFGVPFSAIELTPMIGGNDVSSEQFTLGDADTIASFAKSQGLAGIHYWSYDRDIDCPPGAASATCNSLGNAGSHGFLKKFLGDGLK